MLAALTGNVDLSTLCCASFQPAGDRANAVLSDGVPSWWIDKARGVVNGGVTVQPLDWASPEAIAELPPLDLVIGADLVRLHLCHVGERTVR